jgi:3-(3-hydroxy-phenyl)propionate hydroxylase
MQSIGIVEKVLSHVVEGYGSDYYSPSGTCFLRVHPTTRENGYAKRNAFRQTVFEGQLRDHILGRENADVWFQAELTGVEQNADRVSLRVRRADGSETGVTCDYLAACDGGRSFVRETLGIAMAGSTFRERWLIVDLEDTKFPGRDTMVFCDPRRPAIALPGPNRTRRFEFMLFDGETDEHATSPAFVRRLLEQNSDDAECPIRRTVAYTFHARIADHWREGRIFLAGDAAHLTPPFAGQGMNSGVRDAHNLAWKLSAVVQGRLGPKLLDTYESERREHAWDLILLAMRMGRVMMPRGRFRAFATQTAFRMLKLVPPVRDYFAQMKYRPKARFTRGFLNGTANDPADRLIGRLFPQPEVEFDGKRVLLDEVLGDGFAFLATPGTLRTVLAAIPSNVLEGLNARRVIIGTADASNGGVTVVKDHSGGLARIMAGLPEGLLLIRPDRYAAAFLPAVQVDGSERRLAALIAATW